MELTNKSNDQRIMIKKLLAVGILLLCLYTAEAQKIVGYLPSYRDPSTSNIQYSKVNTIIYAFINPNATGNLITTSGLGSEWDFSLTHFLTVKTNCATYGTKLSISLGGADPGNLRSARLNAVCGNATYRATLVSELVQFAITHNLYEIDVDWEFPTSAGARTNHEALLAALDAAIAASSNPSIKIGVAVGGEYTGGINHLNYFNANAVQYVDDFHIMAYDFPSSYNANNHATEADAQASFGQWNSAKGVPKSKMYLGVPFYGRNPGRTLESDYRSFSVGLASYNVDNYSGYYYNGKTTLENKAQWVTDQGGQGIMIWDLGQDRTDTYSLLNVLYDKMSSICPAPQPSLGPDVGFCSGSVVLNSNVAQAAGRTFSWKKDGVYVVTNSLTANTYTTTAGGIFIVEITQSACTKSDQILVTSGSSLGVTGATRCGPGSVTLSVNTAGGPYDWYTASTGGTAIHTGANYTFNETASNTYYVQQNTGSATYSAGKPVINVPAAWNEAGYVASNSLPRWAHKLVVTTDLTIQSVKIWTSNNTTNGVKIMVLRSIDGSTIQAQTTPVNLPTGGGPYTIAVNITLTAGTYYVGVYAPVLGGGANGVWFDSGTTPVPSSQAGVYSLEGLCYGNYGSGFAAVQTPTYYGQLFDWVITTGVVPPCGRTAVTTTINAAANAGLTVGSTSPICVGVDGTVTVANSESDVSYQAYIGTNTVGPPLNGNGGTLSLTVYNASLSAGANTITIKGTKIGCGTVNLTNTASITVSGSTTAAITFGAITKTYGNAAFNLSGTSASPGAFTYSFVSSVPAAIATVTGAGLTTINGAGTATVKVDQAASGCYAANSATATLTINKATLTVTATNQTRLYGAANATAVFTYSGFVNSENSSVIDVAPTAAHTAIATTNVGSPAINVSGGSDNNYAFSYVSGSLTINKATITATANPQTRNYGVANPTFTITYTGFANSENSSVIDVLPTASSTANLTTSPGGYTITTSGGSDNNYIISLANGTLTIVKANRTVTITSSNSGSAGGTINLTYTTSPSGGTATWSRTNGTGTASLSGAVLSLSTVGTVTVQVDIAADVNYNATSANQVITISNLTTPSITFNGTTKTYGDPVFTISASSSSTGAFTYSLLNSTPSGILTVASNGQITINGAGTATVQVDQASAGSFGAGSATATITVNKANRTVTINSTNSGVTGGIINLTNTLSAGTGSPVWSVTNGTGSATINTTILTLVSSGTVTVQLDVAADANYNAASASQTVTITAATAVVDAQNGSTLNIYPNPVVGASEVHFELSTSTSVKLDVFDMNGHKMGSILNDTNLSAGSYTFGLPELPVGVYLLKLQMGSFEKYTKLVKN